jgi:hypothetical protein
MAKRVERSPFKVEMDALDQQVNGDERGADGMINPRAIVADTDAHSPAGCRRTANFLDEAKFSQPA